MGLRHWQWSEAALELAQRFQRIIATDGSAEQIENAFPPQRVEYRVEPAEATSFLSGTVDLITVGTAVHWFDFDAFYDEVRRVAKPAAILSVWTYHLPSIDPEVDRWLEKYYRETLRGYWPERIRYLDDRYRALPFTEDADERAYWARRIAAWYMGEELADAY